jgi:cobalt/nickel transport system permease protein
MHLADGTIPLVQAAVYGTVSAAVVGLGIRRYYSKTRKQQDFKILCGAFAAFIFVTTIFEIPMPFGSSEHPTGTPLAAAFMGPAVTVFLSLIVLLLELVFREGGITTLGANIFSLGIAGGIVGWGLFHILRKCKAGMFAAGFICGFLGDLTVYLVTVAQLTLGGREGKSFVYYLVLYLPGQVPLALVEGIFTGLVLHFIDRKRPDIARRFGWKTCAGEELS